ncbi:MAG: hypothetical protein P8X96_02730 [Desulfobacteraceae bacterium]
MKTGCWFILIFVWLWSDPLWAGTETSADLIEHFSSGQINWTQGLVTAIGEISAQEVDGMDMRQKGIDLAFRRAARNAYETLLQLRIDDQQSGASLFAEDPYTRSKIMDMAAESKILHMNWSPSGDGTLYVQMSLYGGFSQFVLPSDIRQVQPIKPLNGKVHTPDFPDQPSDRHNEIAEPEHYTGLIVDARGTGAKPSMVPLLLNENGVEVFGPAYVSREYAVQHGICQYIRITNGSWPSLPRVAPKPLVVKGLKTDPQGSCRIVISNADASRLRGSSSHLEFLKQCRVIIVLDKFMEALP